MKHGYEGYEDTKQNYKIHNKTTIAKIKILDFEKLNYS